MFYRGLSRQRTRSLARIASAAASPFRLRGRVPRYTAVAAAALNGDRNCPAVQRHRRPSPFLRRWITIGAPRPVSSGACSKNPPAPAIPLLERRVNGHGGSGPQSYWYVCAVPYMASEITLSIEAVGSARRRLRAFPWKTLLTKRAIRSAPTCSHSSRGLRPAGSHRCRNAPPRPDRSGRPR